MDTDAVLPRRTRTYQNHHLDSTRWDAFTPRAGDIVIATSYKAGTTWTQAIVANLLFPDGAFPRPPWQLSPWLDYRPIPLNDMIAGLEAQRNRRFIKTHLALDGLRFFPELRYVFVTRDARDVAMSLWNHYANLTDESFALYNDTPGRVGAALPRPPEDIATFWRAWFTRGWFEWEGDGWPYWSHLDVTRTWWAFRHLPSILVLNYADMLRDPTGCIGRIARFLDVDASARRIAEVAERVSFQAMKRDGAAYVPRAGAGWKGGVETFMNKGVNGRWRGTITEADLELYDQACARVLDPACRAWMETGALGPS